VVTHPTCDSLSYGAMKMLQKSKLLTNLKHQVYERIYFQKCKDLDPMVYMWKGLVCNINSVCNIHFGNHLDLARTHLLGVAWNKTREDKMKKIKLCPLQRSSLLSFDMILSFKYSIIKVLWLTNIEKSCFFYQSV
jgi:hypothetical protein